MTLYGVLIMAYLHKVGNYSLYQTETGNYYLKGENFACVLQNYLQAISEGVRLTNKDKEGV
jgi:hypothetical protein